MNSLILLISFNYYIILINCNINDELKVIKTEYGLVKGKRMLTFFEDKAYYAFRGIPYARPPIADLRFKPPKPPISWADIKDTFDFGSECMQPRHMMAFGPVEKFINGNEDCLFINVFTPDTTRNLPVMVFIHGGGFVEGSADIYGPDFIINQNDVVLVTLNYRVGIFGFLSFNTPEFSGNMGLKDQLFALRWVNRNIGNFGGDKDMVTIFGESAGAASIHYHLITQNESKLFKRAIIMSGTIKNSWALRPHNDHTEQMFEMARRIGSPISDKNTLIEFFIDAEASVLIEHSIVDLHIAGLPRKIVAELNYVPVLENELDDEPYILENANEIIERDSFKSAIDTMFGFTTMEGFFAVGEEIKDPSLLKPFDRTFEFQLPMDWNVDIQYTSKDYKIIAKKVRDFYFGEGGHVNEDTVTQYVDLMSFIWFTYPVDVAVKQQATKSSGKTFYYTFSVDTESNLIKKISNITLPGASHFDEICYLFRCPFPNFYDNDAQNSVVRNTIENMSKLWVNFAKFGDPSIPSENIIIKPIENNEINYVNISNNGIEVGTNPKGDAMQFWDNIYVNHKNKYKKSKLNIKLEL